jgi:hypothetical protein
MRMVFVSGAAVAASVAGCASITALQLDPKTFTKADKAAEGILYYMPKPHLLVAVGPPIEKRSALTPTEQSDLNKILAKARATRGDLSAQSNALSAVEKSILIESVLKASAKDDKGGGGEQSGAATSGADTASFSVGAGQYLVKLIYLPDCDRPMALKIEAGLFGKIDAQPRLENGWMLTSLGGNVDNSALLTSLADIITANKGSSASTPAPSSTDGTTTLALSGGDSTPPSVGKPLPVGLHPINCKADQGSTIVVKPEEHAGPRRKVTD